MAVLPTGGGKSASSQIAGLALGGLRVVVSFESVGYRHLTRATLANGLLTPA